MSSELWLDFALHSAFSQTKVNVRTKCQNYLPDLKIVAEWLDHLSQCSCWFSPEISSYDLKKRYCSILCKKQTNKQSLCHLIERQSWKSSNFYHWKISKWYIYVLWFIWGNWTCLGFWRCFTSSPKGFSSSNWHVCNPGISAISLIYTSASNLRCTYAIWTHCIDPPQYQIP